MLGRSRAFDRFCVTSARELRFTAKESFSIQLSDCTSALNKQALQSQLESDSIDPFDPAVCEASHSFSTMRLKVGTGTTKTPSFGK